MLVDPSTGEPISLSTTALDMGVGSSAGFISSQAAIGMGGQPGGRFVEAFAHMPASSHVVGWNALRGSQTILKGSKRARDMKASIGSSINATLNPRYWFRLPNYDALDTKARGEKYTPFQMLSGKTANKAVSAMARQSSTLQKMLTPSQLEELKSGKHMDMVGGGFMSRLTASARIGWSNENKANKVRKNIARFVEGSGDDKVYASLASKLGKNFELASPGDLAHAQMSTVRGVASQYVGGYMQGSMFGTENATMRTFLEQGIKKNYTMGAEKAVQHLGGAGLKHVGGRVVADVGTDVGRTLISEGLAKEGQTVGLRTLARAAGNSAFKEAVGEGAGKILMKAGLSRAASTLGMWIPGVNVVMTAMMVHDLTEMGISMAKGGMEFGKEAMKSFQGSMYKPVMGMGYRDTEVAATSRARGVQAIQASRLNARSVLGNEASGMAAHFG